VPAAGTAGTAVVIVNPKSANGTLGKRWPEVQKTLRREYGSFEHVLTESAGDGTRLAREALQQGADTVIAMGGDGTIHEVVNGFFDADARPIRPRASLGILPFGTGGDFRRSARIPKDLGEAARILKNGTARAIDVGRIEFRRGGTRNERASRYFVNIASFGVSGVVDEIANNSSKLLGGKMTFFLASARAGFRYKNKKVRLVFDSDERDALETRINCVAVANGRYFGGGMFVAPNADLHDGEFDVVTIGDLTTFEYMTSGLRIYKGTHLALPKVSVRRAARVEALPVDPDDDVLLDIDGENPGALPATFTLLPRALPVVMPA
jgi:YegS/Rv2252/BmrU family lipid kinase